MDMYSDKEHYATLYSTAPRAYGFVGNTPEELTNWQREFRPRLKQALGLDIMEHELSGATPSAEKANEEYLTDHIREKWYLWTEPTVPLPFFLLRPLNTTQERPLVLTPHGHGHNGMYLYSGIYHNEEERKKIEEGERDIAVQAVREGYIAIAPTTRGFGETRTKKDYNKGQASSCRTNLLHGLLVGRTAIGERVWDIQQLLGWAKSELPIDSSRIAITGNSGGGTISLFAGACLPEIAVVVPSCYFCTFTGSIGSIHHCDCNYVPGILRLGEMYDVAGLIAPRPFRAITGKDDDIFPINQVYKAFAELQNVYKAAQRPDACSMYVGEGGHRFYKDGCWNFVKEAFYP